MNHTKPLHILLIHLFLALFAVGCDKLQPGYYLTPANYPTLPPTPMGTAPPVSPTLTPLSTVQEATGDLATLTPVENDTAPEPIGESPTLTPSATLPPCDETEGQIVEESFASGRPLAPDAVRLAVFKSRRGSRGYREASVDAFLDRVVELLVVASV